MAKVLEYVKATEGSEGKAATYKVCYKNGGTRHYPESTGLTLEEALANAAGEYQPGELGVFTETVAVPAVGADPGRVLLELTWEEARFLRRLVGAHVSGSGCNAAHNDAIYDVLKYMFPAEAFHKACDQTINVTE